MTAHPDRSIRVTAEAVAGQEAAEDRAFPMPRREFYHHPAEDTIGHLLPDPDQSARVPCERELRVAIADVLLKCLGIDLDWCRKLSGLVAGTQRCNGGLIAVVSGQAALQRSFR